MMTQVNQQTLSGHINYVEVIIKFN